MNESKEITCFNKLLIKILVEKGLLFKRHQILEENYFSQSVILVVVVD